METDYQYWSLINELGDHPNEFDDAADAVSALMEEICEPRRDFNRKRVLRAFFYLCEHMHLSKEPLLHNSINVVHWKEKVRGVVEIYEPKIGNE